MASGAAVLTYTSPSGVATVIGENAGTSTCQVTSRPIQIHPKGRECYIDGVRVEVEVDSYTDLANAYFKIGWTDKLDDAVNWYTDPITGLEKFYLDDANSVYDVRLEGRFVFFEVYDEQVQDQWQISAIELYGRPVAGRRN